MKTYGVKECFLTLQGEGARAGTKAVFLRLTGCNMWNGKPADRDKGKGACAQWCDTDFYKGEKHTAKEILKKLDTLWPFDPLEGGERWVVVTGGEPALQWDPELSDALDAGVWRSAMETNGTVKINGSVDWLCVSPKLTRTGAYPVLQVERAEEVKVVLPGCMPWNSDDAGWTDERLECLEKNVRAQHYYVQPQDLIDADTTGKTYLHGDRAGLVLSKRHSLKTFDAHLERCISFVMRNPKWKLSAQVHKYVRLP